jgi:hypothetical protein
MAEEILKEGKKGKEKFSVHQGIIRYKNKIYVGDKADWRGKIMKSLHDTSIGGHLSQDQKVIFLARYEGVHMADSTKV